MDNFFKKMFREPSGKMIGFTDRTPQRDIISEPSGRMMGYTQNGSTFDKNGRHVMQGENPGAFFGQKNPFNR